MEELDLRHTLSKVKAPPGFERMVMTRLHDVKSGARLARVRSLRPRLSWVAGAAALLACLVLVNVVFLTHPGRVPESSTAGLRSNQVQGQVVPVMDSVDYGREVRNVSGDPSTVYILEQVSDSGTYANIRY
jgi:hypothetical protein